jgi:Pilus formation protein N terminal region
MKYLSLLVTILAAPSAYALEFTEPVEIPPGFTVRWPAPGQQAPAFKTVITGNSDVADAVPAGEDKLIIVMKPNGGTTNFLLLDESGEQVANLLVTNPKIQYPLAQDSTTKTWQVYRNDDSCFPVCVDKRSPTKRIVAPAGEASNPVDTQHN